jgi:hypothetical protein
MKIEELREQCKDIRSTLEEYFECTIEDCLQIAEFLNKYDYLDLYNIELKDCEDVADVMYELKYLI